MKKFSATFAIAVSFLFITTGYAQFRAEEVRPFDFTDRYYEENGIFAFTLVDRKNGSDGESVFDTTNDPHRTNIRIAETLPAYTAAGDVVFWNYYAGASRESFTTGVFGDHAVELAYSFPMYVFPSTTVRNYDRQAAMINMLDSYFEKNHIGISAVFLVEYTDQIFTKTGRTTLQMLAERNGVSLDGTPIIRTARELDGLYSDGLVTIRQAGPENSDRMPFALSKVIQFPATGGITSDAFLNYVKEPDGGPLTAEGHILSKFECYQGGGKCL